jgi:hypothetical protein
MYYIYMLQVLSFPYLGNDGSSSDNTTMQQHTVLASVSLSFSFIIFFIR